MRNISVGLINFNKRHVGFYGDLIDRIHGVISPLRPPNKVYM